MMPTMIIKKQMNNTQYLIIMKLCQENGHSIKYRCCAANNFLPQH